MKRFFILISLCVLLSEACYDSKVDRLRLEVLEKRLEMLEQWQQQLNADIEALQEVVKAFRARNYIRSVVETEEGYTLVMSDGAVVHLLHGRKGETGEAGAVIMPLISVRDSSDGHLYWTGNGELLIDAGGRAMRADGVKGDTGDQGQQGPQGQAGMIPQVRIDPETDYWEISLDGGKTWASAGVKATGEKGDTGDPGAVGPDGPAGEPGIRGDGVFAADGVKIREDQVEFTLADGKVFVLPLYLDWKLEFPEGRMFTVLSGSLSEIPFIIKGSGGSPTVEAAGDNGWLASVIFDAANDRSGKIRVQAPDRVGKSSVLVILSDGAGKCWNYQLSFVAAGVL